MATERDYQNFLDQAESLRRRLADLLAPLLVQNPQLAENITNTVDQYLATRMAADAQAAPPGDLGLADLVGIGEEAPRDFAEARIPQGVADYDDTVTSERIIAVGDLYYIYNHEKVGVFRVVKKLQELFQAGTVRLSEGNGAYGLYRYDRREVLRYTRAERLSAYRRIFGYGSAPIPAGGRPNTDFHGLVTNFIRQVTLFWRDKRISEVIRLRAADPSFGSIAVVRRAGLDLRNNLKFASYGNLNVLRLEVMQVLDEAFRILGAEDVRRLFGADNAWDVIEEILTRYFNESLSTSPRQRMAVAGRNILRWLAQPHIRHERRPQFEALLNSIAEDAEEWLTSAETLGLAGRQAQERALPWDRTSPVPDNGRPVSTAAL